MLSEEESAERWDEVNEDGDDYITWKEYVAETYGVKDDDDDDALSAEDKEEEDKVMTYPCLGSNPVSRLDVLGHQNLSQSNRTCKRKFVRLASVSRRLDLGRFTLYVLCGVVPDSSPTFCRLSN